MRGCLACRFLTMLQLALLLLTAVPAAPVEFRLLLILQEDSVDAASVSRLVDRQINGNWRFLPPASGRSLQARVLVSRQGDGTGWTLALKQACEWSNISAIVVAGSCDLVASSQKLALSLGVPCVAVPVGVCLVPLLSDYSLVIEQSANVHLAAAASALASVEAAGAAILFDSMQDTTMVQQLLQLLSVRQIAARTFQIDSAGDVNATTALDSIRQANVKFLVVLASKGNVIRLLQKASVAKLLTVRWHWLVMDSSLSPSELLPWLNPHANVALLRGNTFGLVPSGRCGPVLADTLTHCTVESVTATEFRIVDSILTVSRALSQLSNDSLATAAGATCQATGRWSAGAQLTQLIKQTTAFATFDSSIVNFNGSGSQQDAALEFLGSFSSNSSSPLAFVQSATYDSNGLKVTFTRQSLRLLWPNAFVGFKGATLTVCSPAISPYTMYANGSSQSGYNHDLLQLLGSRLNFRPYLRPPLKADSAESQAACVAEVANGTADLAPLFGMTSSGTTGVEFSVDILPFSNTILVKRPSDETTFWTVFAPLKFDVWMMLIGFFVVTAVISYLLAYFSPFSAWNLQLPMAIVDEVWFKEYLWSSVSSFLQQGHDFYPFAMSPRTVLAFWWMFTVIIFGTYTGELAAILTIKVTQQPVQKLADVATDSAFKIYITRNSVIHSAVLAAETGYLKELRNKMVLTETEKECTEALLQSDYPFQACITDQNLNLHYANTHCTKVYMAKEYFTPSFNGMVFPKNADFIDAFNFMLQKTKESGLADLIRLKYFPTSNPECTVPEVQPQTAPINLIGVGGTCIMTFALFAAGLLVLVLELLYAKYILREPLACY